MDHMFKVTVPDNKKFYFSFGYLMLSGSALFLLDVFFYSPFKDLATALNSKEAVPLSVWFVSGGLALLFGTLWLCFFIISESSKKCIIDLISKK